MDRRNFLKGTAVAAAVPFLPTIRTDALEIEPIEIPGPPLELEPLLRGKSNTILTPNMIVREIIMLTRGKYLEHPCVEVQAGAPKLGDLWSVPGHDNALLSHRISSEWPFSAKDLLLTLDEYSARWLEPISMSLAKRMDEDMAGLSNAVIATAPLEIPQGVVIGTRANWRGLHVRVLKSYFIDQDSELWRVDVMYGPTVKRLFAPTVRV